MKEEILINVTPHESRAAVIENGMLQEIFIERSSSRGLVGNIYRGKVIRVLPGMQAAFIDIGRERSAFLHAAEILPISETELIDEENITQTDINQLLHPGQKITVQVIKDEIGTKGARLTTRLTIPSRYLVLMPDNPHIGVSQRIEEGAERERLKNILLELKRDAKQSGFIVRTAAEGACAQDILRDVEFTEKLWKTINTKLTKIKAPAIAHEELDLPLRIIRDFVPADIEKIQVDSPQLHTRLLSFVKDFAPTLNSSIELYQGDRPLFDVYNVEEEIERSLQRKVQLKSGGYLIVDQTEAMVTVDVNTGGFVGYRNLEDTIFKTNLEAAAVLARQLRLRNLGGMIIVDFIDMSEAEHRRQVIRVLEKSLENDHAKSKISEVSALGLVQMTRKRTRESIGNLLCQPCTLCESRGSIKTAQTICYEIFRELYRNARAYDEVKEYLVLASQEVVDRMLDEEASHLAELESVVGKPVRFQTERLYSQEQFDVIII